MAEREIDALLRLRAWQGLHQLDHHIRLKRSRPNFFRVVPRVTRVEGVHTDVLTWLLTPGHWHGLGDTFAIGLTTAIFTLCHFRVGAAVSIESVRREVSTGLGPIDILITGRAGDEPFVLGVENKIDADESNDQLRRYAQGLQALHPNAAVMLAYLTVAGEEPKCPPPCRFTCISYGVVASELQRALSRAGQQSDAGTELARHYLDILRADVMHEPDPEVDALCRQLFEEHRRAWQAIRRRLPSERDEAHAALGAAACATFARDFGGDWHFTIRRDAYARVFRPMWMRLGVRHDEPIVGVDSLTHWQYAATHIRLVAELPDDDAADGHSYGVRLKVDNRQSSALGVELNERLRLAAQLQIPESDQFTVPLKTKSKQPDVADKPDVVLDWIRRVPMLRTVIEVIDGAIAAP